jgi:hypothetical protein
VVTVWHSFCNQTIANYRGMQDTVNEMPTVGWVAL